ncbi:MAG TPA: ABC transporter permease, partial [Bryobacteraceae bacterium]|nr:ABC transporter permease [Bryobacteraceae bacterium]
EFTIIGVTKKSFGGLSLVIHPDLYIPTMMLPRVQPSGAADPLERRDLRSFLVKARLNPGVTVAQADAEIATLASGLAGAYPATNRNHSMKVRTEVETRILQSPPNAFFSAMLMAVAGLVLVIACANVANLMLSRARARSREMAVRLAIGASRGRLLRQLLTESMLLSLAAAGLGLLIAQYAADYFTRVRFANDLPLSLVVQLDQRVLIFSLIAAILSAVFFGLAPAIQSSKTDLVPALKSGEASSKQRRTLGRNALVIAQVAFSLILLSAATLFVRALRVVVLGNPGFRTDHLLMMTLDPSLVHYSQDKTREFYRTLIERARQLPGVTNATLAQMIPFDGSSLASENIAPEGYVFAQGKDSDTVFSSNVDEHYFDTMGTPIVQGRGILATDTATTQAVAVINEYMAQHYWPHQNPIGKRFRETARDGALVQVVGVARDATYLAVGEPHMAFFYTPVTQHPVTHMTLLVETPAEAANLADPLRNLVRSLDAHQPIYNVRTMRDYYQSQGLFGIRLIVKLVTGMGLLGLTLSLVGLYGLVSYSVTRRTREIGIRMAVGAQGNDILKFVMRQGMMLALAGVAAGLIGCLGTTRLLHAAFTRLADIGSFDVWSFIVLPAALLGITMLASYLPARRAAAIDPNQALHHD